MLGLTTMTKQLLRRGRKFKFVVTLIHFPVGVMWGPVYCDLVGARVGATIGALVGRIIGDLAGLFAGALVGGLMGALVEDLIVAAVGSRTANRVGDWMGDLVRDVMGANAGVLTDGRKDGTTKSGDVGGSAWIGGDGMEGRPQPRESREERVMAQWDYPRSTVPWWGPTVGGAQKCCAPVWLSVT
jgi:hypothetical protein